MFFGPALETMDATCAFFGNHLSTERAAERPRLHVQGEDHAMTSFCPICHCTTPILIDKRFSAPLLQNRVWPDRVSARAAPVGELEFVLCAACGFTWNRAFRPDGVVYDQAYDNDQMGSPQFRAHVAAMSERILTRVPSGRLTHLVEVGCGQGSFLTELARSKRFASLTGFDPAWRGKEGLQTDGTTIHHRYFGWDALDLVPDGPLFIVARHTIEHVTDPMSFLRAIRATMKPNDDGRLFLETADIEWIIETFQPQDLFYEHRSIFSRDALRVALAAAGFELLSIDRAFNDQYLWVEARPTIGEKRINGRCEFTAAAENFANRRDRFLRVYRAWMTRIAANRTVWLWGASSKGVTFAQLVDPDGSQLAGAIDINQKKIGYFMPGTGLPIVSPSVLRNGDTVIIMNPNYHAEITSCIGGMGITARLLSVDSVEYQADMGT
jgi:SAM-dependent methyltransferase